jgi:hypothetical protein
MQIGKCVRAALVLGALACSRSAQGADGQNGAAEPGGQGYFVLGASVPGYLPDDARIMIRQGDVVDGKICWRRDPEIYFGAPHGGFIMEQAPAGVWLGVASISPQMGAPAWTPRTEALTFQVKSGDVSYITSEEFILKAAGAPANIKPDFAAAKRYMHVYHPTLEGKLTQGTYEMQPTKPGCGFF